MCEQIDELELQRLLDGRLTPADRDLLLHHAERYPNNWKQIALAFVEEQILHESFDDPAQLQPAVQFATDTRPAKTKTPKWTNWLAQAATMLLMLGIGASLGGYFWQQPDYTIVVTPPSQSAVAAAPQQVEQRVLDRLFKPVFDQESRSVFRDHGFQISEEPVIYIVQGQHGEQYVVPQRNVSLIAHRD